MNSSKNNETQGRPPSWPVPTTDIARRLQQILPKVGKRKLAELFFGGISEGKVRAILEGTTEPPPSGLYRIFEETGKNLDWLIVGKDKNNPKSPPALASGGKVVGLDLIQMLFRLQAALANVGHHLATEGNKSEDVLSEALELLERTHNVLERTRNLQAQIEGLQENSEDHDRHDQTA